MRSKNSAGFSILAMTVLLPLSSLAQNAVEAASASANSAATSSAAGKTVGNSLQKIFGSTSKTLDRSPGGSKAQPLPLSSPATVQATAAEPQAKNDREVLAQANAIAVGAARQEVVDKLGKPSMSLTGSDGETLWFNGKDGSLEVHLKDGKVSRAIEKPAATTSGT